jgi:predicted transcriptional regulator of viral defense system
LPWQSNAERALFDCALRVDLAGSVERLAEALAAGSREVDPKRIKRLAKAFGARGRAAERRLASLAKALDLPFPVNPVVGNRQPMIRLNPRDERVHWTDDGYRVVWPTPISELRAIVEN